MPDTNYNAGGSQDNPGELDRMLDATLAKYAVVEPRVGLEERVLAHLRAEPLRPSQHGWLQWGLVGAVAMIAVVAILAWRPNQFPHPPIANHPSAMTPRPATQKAEPAPHSTDVASAKHDSGRKRVARRAPPSTAVAAYPKLDQFPSPQPLTAEEIALAQYVKNFPTEARLVAQTQEEFELEAQKEMNDVLETRLSVSTQHER